MFASAAGHLETVAVLLEYKAQVNLVGGVRHRMIKVCPLFVVHVHKVFCLPYSGKFLHGANCRLTLHKVKTEYGQLVFCQTFERPTQRLLIGRTIKTEAKKAHKPGAR